MAVSVSLKKLAEILGLAPSTVSRALKGHPDISRATQERVRALAQESGLDITLKKNDREI